MLPAANKGVGMNMGFPDVCLTPAAPSPVPIPYPNMAMNAMAAPFCPTILLSAMPALNMGSMIPMTLGMQPGVANPLYMQMGAYTMGNPKIMMMGLPAINLTCPTTGNAMNNAVGAVLVPSVTNVFFTYLSQSVQDGSDRAHPQHELSAFRESLAGRDPAVEDGGVVDDVGYITIRRFSSDVPAAFYNAVRSLTRRGMVALVIDARNNPGGEMSAAIELAGDFLPIDSLIVTMTDVDGDELAYRTHETPLYTFPVTLLVDERTASAAELFVGALHAHRRAVVRGTKTYGKGEAQTFIAGETGAIYGTVGTFKLPNGASVHGVGIEPDLTNSFDGIARVRCHSDQC